MIIVVLWFRGNVRFGSNLDEECRLRRVCTRALRTFDTPALPALTGADIAAALQEIPNETREIPDLRLQPQMRELEQPGFETTLRYHAALPRSSRCRAGRDAMRICAWCMSAAAAALLLAASLGACSTDSSSDASGGQGRVQAISPSSVATEGGPNIGAPAGDLMSNGARPAQAPPGTKAPTPAPAGQAAMPANTAAAFLAGDAGRLQGELDQIKARVASRGTLLPQIRDGLARDTAAYQAATGAVGTGVQSGKATGDPALLGQWTDAQAALARMDASMGQLVALSAQSSQDAASADYIADSAKRAGALQGSAADRQRLAAIEADAAATGAAARTQKTAIGTEIEKQTATVTRDRAELMQLASAIDGGPLHAAGKGQNSAVPRATAAKPAAARIAKGAPPHSGTSAPPASPPGDLDGKAPLVVIRFDQPNVPYDEPVRKAAALALRRKPTAIFDVVASAPAEGAPDAVASAREKSKADAEGVVRSLMNAGVPSNQLTLTLATPETGAASEVRIFVR
jgi:hypothetical protein